MKNQCRRSARRPLSCSGHPRCDGAALADGEPRSRRGRRPHQRHRGLRRLAPAGHRSPDVAFNLYRSTGGGAAVQAQRGAARPADQLRRHDGRPRAGRTPTSCGPVVFGIEEAPSARLHAARERSRPAATCACRCRSPPAARRPIGEAYTYSANDASVGDLDGDGEYEIVVQVGPVERQGQLAGGLHRQRLPRRLQARRHAAVADRPRAATSAPARTTRSSWSTTSTATAGPRSRARPRTARSTAPGNVIGDRASATGATPPGYILAGPGVPHDLRRPDRRRAGDRRPTSSPRGTVGDWGDSYGNRVDRFLAGVAYLDGERPSLVMARGYYTRAVLAAWNWRDGAAHAASGRSTPATRARRTPAPG